MTSVEIRRATLATKELPESVVTACVEVPSVVDESVSG